MFLKIVGIIALVLLGLLVLAILLITWFYKKCIKNFNLMHGEPAEIHLHPDEEAEWVNKGEARELIEDLKSLGFAEGSAYTILEMDKVRLLSVGMGDQIYGCVYNVKGLGMHIDLCVDFLNGDELTVTSAPTGEQMETRPEKKGEYLSGASASELLARLKELMAGKEIKPVSLSDFSTVFEQCYKKDMLWRAARGGVTLEEVRRVAHDTDEEVSEEAILEAFKQTKLGELNRWEGECVGRFEETSEMSVKDWNRYQYSMFIYLKNFYKPAYLEYLEQIIEVDPKELLDLAGEGADPLTEETLQKIFKAKGIHLKKLGAVDFPVFADLYGYEDPENPSEFPES